MLKSSEPNVAAVMTPAPIVLTPDAPLSLAMRTMARHSFRHLPVVEEGAFVGLISERDLLAAREGDRVVRDVMTSDCVVTTADASAAAAAGAMLRMKIGCLPVLDGDTLVGIVTESDFVRVAYAVLSAVSASVARAQQRSEAASPKPHPDGAQRPSAKARARAARPAKKRARRHARAS